MPDLQGGLEELRIGTVLAAVDGSEYGLAALQAAVRIAALLDAELRVLHVEDSDLLGLPSVPWIKEMDPLSGEIRQLQAVEVERKVRWESTRVRRALDRVLVHTQLRWSFSVTRGRVVSELLEAAKTADLISLGVRRHSLGLGPGSSARAVIEHSGKPVMMVWRGARMGKRVCVLFDGSPEALKGLALACRLTRDRDSELFLILDAPGEERARLVEAAASSLRSAEDAGAEISIVPREAAWKVACHLRRLACGLLVIPRAAMQRSEAVAAGIREGLECPLLILG